MFFARKGGAWAIPEPLWERSHAGVRRAATDGFDVLAAGGSALDAVERAVRWLSTVLIAYFLDHLRTELSLGLKKN